MNLNMVMLQRLGQYLTKNRVNALWVALVLALLPVLGMPTSWLSMILIGFVTLRNGPKEGFLVLLWSALPAVALSVLGYYGWLVNLVLLRGLVLWALAVMLGRTASWSWTIQTVIILGAVMIAALHCFIGNLPAFWMAQLSDFWQDISQSFNWHLSPVQIESMLQFVSRLATGIVAVMLLSFDLLLLMMARGWQARAFNPGGLAKELHQIRMGLGMSAVVVICVLAASLGSDFAMDMLPLLIFPFALAGLSLVHARLLVKKEIRLPLLVGLYMALLFFMPYMAIGLAILGLTDSWFDFRALRRVNVF